MDSNPTPSSSTSAMDEGAAGLTICISSESTVQVEKASCSSSSSCIASTSTESTCEAAADPNMELKGIADQIVFLLQNPFKVKSKEGGSGGGDSDAGSDDDSEYEEVTDPDILKSMREWYAETTEESIIQRRLLHNEDGHEKRLSEVIKLHLHLVDVENMDSVTRYQYFKHTMLKIDNLRLITKKNCLLVQNIEKANEYLEKVKVMLSKRTKEFRALLDEQRRKNAEIEKQRKELEKVEAIMKKLESSVGITKLQEDIAKHQKELKKLQARDTELSETLAQRKTFLTYLCELAKKLHDENELETRDNAVAEVENDNVFSDWDLD